MLRHRPNCATDHQGERQIDEKKFRHNVAERFIPWVQTPSVARGVKAMKHKRLKTRRIAEQQLTVVIFLSQSFGYIAYQAGSPSRVF
jgi:hypothetical protein